MKRNRRVNKFLANGRSDFLAGLAVVLPVVGSIAVVVWFLAAVSAPTENLLFFVPGNWILNGAAPLQLYWRVIALGAAIVFIGTVGRVGRHYFGRKLIQGVDLLRLRIPLLNKMYLALKQIHEAVTSSKRSSFKQVVLVEFPRPGLFSIGFLAGAQNNEARRKTHKQLLGVFVPNPPMTRGAVVPVPEADVVRLEMSVADGIKFIIGAPNRLPPPANLVGWWPSDGSAHVIGGARDGTLQGEATATASGYDGLAFSFGGINGYVSISDVPAIHPATLPAAFTGQGYRHKWRRIFT